MRILTVRQPWAWAIIHGGKNVENRVRNIAGDYRGPVLIHAAKTEDAEAYDIPYPHPITSVVGRLDSDPRAWQLRGVILGVVDLVDVHLGSRLEGYCWHDKQGMQAKCSEWSESEAFHLVLANPRALDEPIPYKGALGLRKTEFDVVGDYLAAPWGHRKGQVCTPMGCEPGCHLEPVARLVGTS